MLTLKTQTVKKKCLRLKNANANANANAKANANVNANDNANENVNEDSGIRVIDFSRFRFFEVF